MTGDGWMDEGGKERQGLKNREKQMEGVDEEGSRWGREALSRD